MIFRRRACWWRAMPRAGSRAFAGAGWCGREKPAFSHFMGARLWKSGGQACMPCASACCARNRRACLFFRQGLARPSACLQQRLNVWLWAGFRRRCALKAAADFAMGLIAAKPVKPCDGGLFWALNLLSKKEQIAPGAQPRPACGFRAHGRALSRFFGPFVPGGAAHKRAWPIIAGFCADGRRRLLARCLPCCRFCCFSAPRIFRPLSGFFLLFFAFQKWPNTSFP